VVDAGRDEREELEELVVDTECEDGLGRARELESRE